MTTLKSLLKPVLILGMFQGLLVACQDQAAQRDAASRANSDENPYADYQSENYTGTENWLCHPEKGLGDVCDLNQDLSAVSADGSITAWPFTAAENPAVDCFYIYPTVSLDPGPNSDFVPGTEEIMTTQAQFARYGGVCRPFAPVYRQVTLGMRSFAEGSENSGIGWEVMGPANEDAKALAYGDVVDAFRQYMGHFNNGRPFIIVGHSQGAGWAIKLVAEEVENQPFLLERLVSAHIIGDAVMVPVGDTVGGSFQSVPVCTQVEQSACVVTYASYRQGDPDLETGRFGVSLDQSMQAACTNPASLASGLEPVEAAIPLIKPPFTQAITIPRGSGGPYASRPMNLTINSPFFSVPGQLFAECKTLVAADRRIDYLEMSIVADPNDPRADDYAGEIVIPGFGLHIVDMSWPQQSLIALAAKQTQAWVNAQHEKP